MHALSAVLTFQESLQCLIFCGAYSEERSIYVLKELNAERKKILGISKASILKVWQVDSD